MPISQSPLFTFLFSFEGSFARLDWWKAQLGVIILSVILGALQAGFAAQVPLIFPIIAAVSLILCILIGWVALASHVKRSHDLGVSGWWVLLLFIPILGFVYAICLAFAPAGTISSMMSRK